VILCGGYTKMADTLHQDEKIYQSTFEFTRETTTLDLDGEVVKTSDVVPMIGDITKVLPEMVGDIEIEVPRFSAVHINGERAYSLARKGVDFIPPKRVVNITRFELLKQISDKEFYFEIECQAGTYIRSLAKLMAQKLGTVGIASTITRTRVGKFNIERAKRLEDITLEDIIEL